MKYLYLWLDIGSFLIPFLFSFHPKLQFYKKWRSVFPAILLMMVFFISWDVFFTKMGIWGFNEAYITGYYFFNLPIEEWLFFFCIPYACVFTHYALLHFFPQMRLSTKTTHLAYVLLITLLLIVLIFRYDRLYTLIDFCYAILVLGIVYNYNRELLSTFFISILVIMIPFILVNGILTGSGIDNPVVWYNDSENLDLRVLTIPVEDFIYTISMILTILALTEYFEGKRLSKNSDVASSIE